VGALKQRVEAVEAINTRLRQQLAFLQKGQAETQAETEAEAAVVEEEEETQENAQGHAQGEGRGRVEEGG